MTTQSNMTEVETSRLEKYVERLREQPQWRNQLLIKNGQATFVKNGKVHTCNKIEGYVKLPDMKCVEPIQQIEMSIGFAPKMRMILWKDKKAYFRGYRKANTDGCILFIHAIKNGKVYYSDNYRYNGKPEGSVIIKSVNEFTSYFSSNYGGINGAVHFKK